MLGACTAFAKLRHSMHCGNGHAGRFIFLPFGPAADGVEASVGAL